MEGIAITHIGIEDYAKTEISSIIGHDAAYSKGALTFPIDGFRDLCSLAYRARLLSSVMFKISSSRVRSPGDLRDSLSLDDFRDWIKEDSTFAVRCRRVGDHAFSSQEVEQEIGEIIHEGIGASVDLTRPDVQVLVHMIDNDCHVGIDFAGVDLSKRSYRIFSFGDPLKGTVAQAMNMIADIKGSDRILDPFSSSGLISIEAAMYLSDKSPHFYDKEGFIFTRNPKLGDIDFDSFFKDIDGRIKDSKLDITCSDHLQKNVRSAEKNAKIAGVNKMLNFSRLDIEWLDTKFDEGSVDKIVTHPPQISKRVKPEHVLKVMDEFFYVSKVILSEKGRIVMVFNHPEELEPSLKKHGFRIEKNLRVLQGGETLSVLMISKSS